MAVTFAPLSQHNNQSGLATVPVASAATKSSVIDCTDLRPVGVFLPADISSATEMTFEAAISEGGTFVPVYDDTGSDLAVTIAASRYVDLPFDKLKGVPYLKLVLNQEQAAARTLYVTGQGL